MLVKADVSNAYWFHRDVFIICKLELYFPDECYMDKTLEELQDINSIPINRLVSKIFSRMTK